MARACTLCSRLDRSALDVELARPDLNVADFCRRHSLGRAAVDRHRSMHVPAMLRIYSARVDLPKLGELHGEYLRLYTSALDALAQAQAGTLLHIDEAGVEHRTVSHTAISRAINEARKTLDSVVRLAADAAETDERPRGMPDAELSARIASALERTMARQQIGAGAQDVDDAIGAHAAITQPLIEVEGIEDVTPAEGLPPLPHTPGSPVVVAPPLSTTQMSLDAVKANRTAPGLTQHAREVIEADQATTATPPSQHEDTVIMRLPNPRYPGSPAATEEERTAAGYADLEITLADLRTNADTVADIIAQHRRETIEEVG